MTTRTWWHVYGGEVANMSTGGGPAWGQVMFGDSTVPPVEAMENTPKATIGTGDSKTQVPYLASFDHEPTDDELNELRPVEYQDA